MQSSNVIVVMIVVVVVVVVVGTRARVQKGRRAPISLVMRLMGGLI